MNKIDPLLAQFEHECTLTRKMLECVPQEKWEYRPHPKSMSLQQLAGHLAEIPQWVAATCAMDVFEMEPGAYKPFLPATTGELVSRFDEEAAKARDVMATESDEHLLQTWTMKSGGRVIIEMPRIAVLRGFIISHSIHHRGQLSVYLRINDVPLPSIYGPSADDPGM